MKLQVRALPEDTGNIVHDGWVHPNVVLEDSYRRLSWTVSRCHLTTTDEWIVLVLHDPRGGA